MEGTEGASVKRDGKVLQRRASEHKRSANFGCRVEPFGRMCRCFDSTRIRWVNEMGFGGLLNLVDMHLPRNLCYWLMTRIDATKKVFIAPDGRKFYLSKNQIKWVLGIPGGAKPLPCRVRTEEGRRAISLLREKYDTSSKHRLKAISKMGSGGRRDGFLVSESIIMRLAGQWQDNEEDDFKKLFLISALCMVLCPTQSSYLAKDLLPTITCVNDAPIYDWCGLVLDKLMRNVKNFSRRFYARGSAGGAGGCTIFLAIFYLDRLARPPIRWGHHPRIGVWHMEDIRNAKREDKGEHGDYGALGMLDVAYGEQHPFEGRDKGTVGSPVADKVSLIYPSELKCRRGAPPWTKCQLRNRFVGDEYIGEASSPPATDIDSGFRDGNYNVDIDLELSLNWPINCSTCYD